MFNIGYLPFFLFTLFHVFHEFFCEFGSTVPFKKTAFSIHSSKLFYDMAIWLFLDTRLSQPVRHQNCLLLSIENCATQILFTL